MEDLVQSLTRGNPGSVKTVLAAVVLALAGYQVVLAAIGDRAGSRPALLTHRSSGDAIVVRGRQPFGGALPYLGTTVFALPAATGPSTRTTAGPVANTRPWSIGPGRIVVSP